MDLLGLFNIGKGIYGGVSNVLKTQSKPAPAKPAPPAPKTTPKVQKILPQALALAKKTTTPSVTKQTATQPTQVTQQAQQDPQTMTFERVAQSITQGIEKFSQMTDEYNKKYKEFDAANPFAYDKILEEEKTKVSQRLDPYYNQTLDDYLTGINRTRQRSLDDERSILGELTANTDFYQGRAQQNLQDAIESSREGFADSGLYGSGKQLRSEGQLTEKTNSTLNNYLTNAENRKQNVLLAGRRLREEDLPLEERLKRRDLTQEKSYNVESQALGEVQRRQRQREFERSQYTGAPPSINPLQFDSASYNYLG